MKKPRKVKRIPPDEAFSWGPVRVARFGSNIVWQSNWGEGDFDEMQKRLVERFPIVIKEIDSLVMAIADQVSVLPAEKVLHRAWWEMAGRHVKLESEVEVDTEDALSMRMIDYIQSVIASVSPGSMRTEVTEEDWQALNAKVDELFRKLNLEYQLCRAAQRRAEDPQISVDFEEFQFKAQLYWCNVRGNRYQVHELAYLRDVFLPHSDVLLDLFSITAAQFIAEIKKIWHALTFGFAEAFESMDQFRADAMNALEGKLAGNQVASESEMRELMARILKEEGWEARQTEVIGQLFGMDLFDVQKVAGLPKSLLDELTWSPGEEGTFFADGAFKGWPLRIWPIFRRPFIRLGERYYCFHLHSLFDNLYRVMQRIICRLRPDYQETWNRIQQELSEALPFKYLQQILPGASVLRSVHYQWYAGEPGRKQWCETDGILVYDDHLFIIEARAGAFTYTSPATDFPAYVESLRNLVLKPATQGKRFLQYLDSDEAVTLFDKDHRPVGELRRKDFRHVTICPVTLDPFTELAAQVQHLRKVGVDVGEHPVWAISLDDLRVYADIFDNPLTFLHFVEERMRAFHSRTIQSDDELDHLGLYLKHNDYSKHAEQMRSDTGASITFHGYRSEIDKFFTERLHDPKAPCRLGQPIPIRLLEIIKWLAVGVTKDRTQLSSYLLDLGGDFRDQLSQSIVDELRRQPTSKRARPLSTHGEVRLTVFCRMRPWVTRDAEEASDHAYAVMLLANEPDRFLVELSYDETTALTHVKWQRLTLDSLSEADRIRLRARAEELRQARVSAAKLTGKVGRNQPCPCGSGKKYKKCCLSR
jgi:hypothetical protein